MVAKGFEALTLNKAPASFGYGGSRWIENFRDKEEMVVLERERERERLLLEKMKKKIQEKIRMWWIVGR